MLAKRAWGGIALLAVGCSGRDISLSTGNGGASGSGHDSGAQVSRAGRGGDSTGGTYFGSTGSGQPSDFGTGGSASSNAISGGSDGFTETSSGEAGRSGWVAYDADLDGAGGQGRHIQIATTDGVCKRPLTDGVAQEKQPAFSKNGKQIAFASDSTGTFQIYVMDLATGTRRQITNHAQGAFYPSWSPDGATLAYVTGAEEDEYDGSSTLTLVDLATLKTTVLTAARQPPYTWSAFASDQLLLVGNGASLIGIHTETRAQYDVVPSSGRTLHATSPSISPDGERFVFIDNCDVSQQLYIARVDGTTGDTCSNATHLLPNGDWFLSASWGPTGDVAAETDHHDIVLVPSDGTFGIQVLVNTPALERNPAFAPTTTALNCTK